MFMHGQLPSWSFQAWHSMYVLQTKMQGSWRPRVWRPTGRQVLLEPLASGKTMKQIHMQACMADLPPQIKKLTEYKCLHEWRISRQTKHKNKQIYRNIDTYRGPMPTGTRFWMRYLYESKASQEITYKVWHLAGAKCRKQFIIWMVPKIKTLQRAQKSSILQPEKQTPVNVPQTGTKKKNTNKRKRSNKKPQGKDWRFEQSSCASLLCTWATLKKSLCHELFGC